MDLAGWHEFFAVGPVRYSQNVAVSVSLPASARIRLQH